MRLHPVPDYIKSRNAAHDIRNAEELERQSTKGTIKDAIESIYTKRHAYYRQRIKIRTPSL